MKREIKTPAKPRPQRISPVPSSSQTKQQQTIVLKLGSLELTRAALSFGTGTFAAGVLVGILLAG